MRNKPHPAIRGITSTGHRTTEITNKLELRAGAGSFGIYRDGVRVASISTAIMDQEEIGRKLAAAQDAIDACRQVRRAAVSYELNSPERQEAMAKGLAMITQVLAQVDGRTVTGQSHG